ncbi:MAG: hypothetical protein ACXAC6_13800 [Candidatus Hodarchaeales archaeon]|jgi:hypothetical protein
MHKKISKEKNYLKSRLNTWERLIQENAPLQERVAQAQVEEYLFEAKKMVSFSRSSS